MGGQRCMSRPCLRILIVWCEIHAWVVKDVCLSRIISNPLATFFLRRRSLWASRTKPTTLFFEETLVTGILQTTVCWSRWQFIQTMGLFQRLVYSTCSRVDGNLLFAVLPRNRCKLRVYVWMPVCKTTLGCGTVRACVIPPIVLQWTDRCRKQCVRHVPLMREVYYTTTGTKQCQNI